MQMLFWNLNIICGIQPNTLKSKPLHVFNNTVYPSFFSIVKINFFLLWRKSFFGIQFILVCCCVQVKFTLLNQHMMINLINIQLDIVPQNEYKHIYCIIVVCWCKVCVQTIKNNDIFQDIGFKKYCSVARH